MEYCDSAIQKKGRKSKEKNQKVLKNKATQMATAHLSHSSKLFWNTFSPLRKD